MANNVVINVKTDLAGQLGQTTDSNISYTENEIFASYAEASSYLTTDSGNTYGAEYTIDGSEELRDSYIIVQNIQLSIWPEIERYAMLLKKKWKIEVI